MHSGQIAYGRPTPWRERDCGPIFSAPKQHYSYSLRNLAASSVGLADYERLRAQHFHRTHAETDMSDLCATARYSKSLTRLTHLPTRRRSCRNNCAQHGFVQGLVRRAAQTSDKDFVLGKVFHDAAAE